MELVGVSHYAICFTHICFIYLLIIRYYYYYSFFTNDENEAER